ncbi:MAG TPA: hypothetical protein VGB46_06790 [Flavisolibacter sp.]
MDKRKEIEHLFSRYLANECTPEEERLLAEYFNTGENELLLKSLIQKELQNPHDNGDANANPSSLDEVLRKLKDRMRGAEDNK